MGMFAFCGSSGASGLSLWDGTFVPKSVTVGDVLSGFIGVSKPQILLYIDYVDKLSTKVNGTG